MVSVSPLDRYGNAITDFPEGGLRAWSVVAGAFLVLFPSFGFMVSIGTLQNYWQRHQLRDYTVRDVGWIPSVFVYLALGLGIWVGPVFDRHGHKWLTWGGGAAYVVMMFVLAQCEQYWQFMLVVGLWGGATGACLPTTSLGIVGHWFRRRRGFAAAIAMCGSSFGGLAIPLMLRRTLALYGYAWAIRILAFTFAGCILVGNLLLRPRLYPDQTQSLSVKKIMNLKLFGDWRLLLLTLSIFGFELVLFGALGLLPTYARSNGQYTDNTSFYVISIMNGLSCLGRLIPGLISDYVGRYNMMAVMTLVTLLFMLALWLPLGTSSLAGLYAFVALFGFGTGTWMALVSPCVAQICRVEEFGRYFGTLYFIASFATLVCIPIGGEMLEAVGPKVLVGFFCAITAASLATFLGSRWACLGWRWKWLEKV